LRIALPHLGFRFPIGVVRLDQPSALAALLWGVQVRFAAV
jgi:hypothetical protein